MRDQRLRPLALSAMFMACGLLLPFLTGQIPQVGSMLLPMHIPVLLCGMFCGPRYGAIVGFVLPPLRFLLFTMPPAIVSISMAFELLAYGLCMGLFINRFPKNLPGFYGALILSMTIGRVVWGAVQFAVLGLAGSTFSFELFIAGALITAIPGIILQLILLPAISVAMPKMGVGLYEPRTNPTATA